MVSDGRRLVRVARHLPPVHLVQDDAIRDRHYKNWGEIHDSRLQVVIYLSGRVVVIAPRGIRRLTVADIARPILVARHLAIVPPDENVQIADEYVRYGDQDGQRPHERYHDHVLVRLARESSSQGEDDDEEAFTRDHGHEEDRRR